MLDLGAYLIAVAQLAAIAGALAWAIRCGAPCCRRSPVPPRVWPRRCWGYPLLLICELLGLIGLFEELPRLLTCLAIRSLGLRSGTAGRAPSPAGGGEGALRGAPAAPAERGGNLPTGPAARSLRPVGRTLQLDRDRRPGRGLHPLGMPDPGGARGHLRLRQPVVPPAVRGPVCGDREIWDFHYTTPVLLSWFYPANSELLHAAGMVIIGRDVLSPLLNLGWSALALLASWCLGRPWGVGGLSVLGALVVLDAGVFADQPGTRGTM